MSKRTYNGKNEGRVGWGGMETEGRCLWPTLVTVTTILKFLIIVAFLSWQWSENMEMMPEETSYSTVSMPTLAHALWTTIQHTGIRKHVHRDNHTQAQTDIFGIYQSERRRKGLLMWCHKRCPVKRQVILPSSAWKCHRLQEIIFVLKRRIRNLCINNKSVSKYKCEKQKN